MALVLALVSQPGCGLAQRAAKGATQGAVETIARKAGDREGLERLTEGITRRTTAGVVGELSQPERLEAIQRIAAAMAAGTVSGASRAVSGARDAFDRAGGRATAGVSPVEAIAGQAAGAFSRGIIAELGPAGDGPLATSLSATTEQVTESIARGARGELAPLFPECRGADAASCLDRAVERVSRATSAGVAAGIRESLGVWPVVLAFGGGALGALVVVWAWGVYRARRLPAVS